MEVCLHQWEVGVLWWACRAHRKSEQCKRVCVCVRKHEIEYDDLDYETMGLRMLLIGDGGLTFYNFSVSF